MLNWYLAEHIQVFTWEFLIGEENKYTLKCIDFKLKLLGHKWSNAFSEINYFQYSCSSLAIMMAALMTGYPITNWVWQRAGVWFLDRTREDRGRSQVHLYFFCPRICSDTRTTPIFWCTTVNVPHNPRFLYL